MNRRVLIISRMQLVPQTGRGTIVKFSERLGDLSDIITVMSSVMQLCDQGILSSSSFANHETEMKH